MENDNNVITPEIEEKEERKLSVKYQVSNKKNRIRFITRISMFSALSLIFYAWLKFPLPIFPSFLEVNFSNLFILIGALSTGPIGAIIIVVMRFILKIVVVGSHTMYVGELTDVILSIMVSVPASIFYLYVHNKKGGYISMLVAFLMWLITSILVNAFISLPFYINAFGFDAVIGMLTSTINGINESNYMMYYLLYAVLPFNLLIGFVNCGLACLVYKRISSILKKIGI